MNGWMAPGVFPELIIDRKGVSMKFIRPYLADGNSVNNPGVSDRNTIREERDSARIEWPNRGWHGTRSGESKPV